MGRKIAILLLMACLLISPALAAENILIQRDANTAFVENATLYEAGYFHTSSYIPEEYVWLAIIIGLVSLIASAFVKKEINVFLLFPPILWGWAAYYSAYMVRDIVSTTGACEPMVILTEIVYVQPVLQYVLWGMTAIASLYAVYVLFFLKDDTYEGYSDGGKNYRTL